MAYQNPSFNFLHAYRDAGASGLTVSPAAAATGPVDYLIDDRAGSLCVAGSAATSGFWLVDRGAGTLEDVDRLLIPAGHNLDGRSLTISQDDNAGFTSPTALATSIAVSGSGLIDITLASITAERYVTVAIDTGASLAWEIGEVFLTRKRTLSRGPNFRWKHPSVDNVIAHTNAAGVESFRVIGAARKTYDLQWGWIDGADLTVLQELEAAVGTHTPFYFDPPDDSFPTVLVTLSELPDIEQDREVPATGHSHRYRLRMVETLG